MNNPQWTCFFMFLVYIDQFISLVAFNSKHNNQTRILVEEIYTTIIIQVFFAVLSVLFILLIPLINLSVNKKPILLVVLILLKDIILTVNFSTDDFLTRFIAPLIIVTLQNYVIAYSLRQLQLLLERNKAKNQTVTYLEMLIFFLSIASVLGGPLSEKFISLQVYQMCLVEGSIFIILSIIAIYIYKSKQFIDNRSLSLSNSNNRVTKCMVLKTDKTFTKIIQDLKLDSKKIQKIIPILVLYGIISTLTMLRINQLYILQNNLQMKTSSLFGFGSLASTVIFNLCLKIKFKTLGVIIVCTNILAIILLQIHQNSTFSIIALSIFSGFASILLLIWIFTVISLIFSGKYQIIALALTFITLGSGCIVLIETYYMFTGEYQVISKVVGIICFMIFSIWSIFSLQKLNRGNLTYTILTRNSRGQRKQLVQSNGQIQSVNQYQTEMNGSSVIDPETKYHSKVEMEIYS